MNNGNTINDLMKLAEKTSYRATTKLMHTVKLIDIAGALIGYCDAPLTSHIDKSIPDVIVLADEREKLCYVRVNNNDLIATYKQANYAIADNYRARR